MEGKLPPDGMDENPVSQSPGQEVGGSYKLIRVLGRSERRSAMVPHRTGIAWSRHVYSCPPIIRHCPCGCVPEEAGV